MGQGFPQKLPVLEKLAIAYALLLYKIAIFAVRLTT